MSDHAQSRCVLSSGNPLPVPWSGSPRRDGGA
jgi:hypothetical protein